MKLTKTKGIIAKNLKTMRSASQQNDCAHYLQALGQDPQANTLLDLHEVHLSQAWVAQEATRIGKQLPLPKVPK
jgi:hypothetical protein